MAIRVPVLQSSGTHLVSVWPSCARGVWAPKCYPGEAVGGHVLQHLLAVVQELVQSVRRDCPVVLT